MESVQIAEKIKEKFPDSVLSTSEYKGQASVVLNRESIVDVCRWLHDDPEMQMDLLRDITGVDWLGKKIPRFEVVFHLYSLGHRHMIRLKTPVSEDNPAVKSVTSVWKGAEWHERECFDMFGIEFQGNPDLRRVLMPEDWEGYPLRKDYPLEGPALENDWPGYREVLEKAGNLKKYEWNR